jgi:hypothetical protein
LLLLLLCCHPVPPLLLLLLLLPLPQTDAMLGTRGMLGGAVDKFKVVSGGLSLAP